MANKFWVGGTGNWNDTTHWSVSSGGAGSAGVPGVGDSALVDNHASGLNGGTLTVDIDISVQSFLWTTAIGTIDNSANHNVTVSATAGFNGSGTTARTFLGGTGTYTLNGAAATWNISNVTSFSNPTTAFASCTITVSGVNTTTATTFNGGTCTYGTVNFNANKCVNMAGTTGIIGTLNITGPNEIRFSQGATVTLTNAFAWTGTSAAPILICNSNTTSGVATITTGSGTTNTAAWCGFDRITFTPVGGSTLTAINSLDFGLNTGTGFTITSPGGGGVIGG